MTSSFLKNAHLPKREKTTTILSVLIRVLALGAALALAAYLVPLLVHYRMWVWLVIVGAATAAMFLLYSTRRFVPGKYLFPGTFFLAVFLIIPIVLTVQISFTNYGDSNRGTRTKDEAISAIIANSVKQTPDSPTYDLRVGTTGSVTDGPFTLFLFDPDTSEIYTATAGSSLEPAEPGAVTLEGGKVTAAEGYTLLSAKEVNAASAKINELDISIDDEHFLQVKGFNQAVVATASMVYDEDSDTLTDTSTGNIYTVQRIGTSDFYVNGNGTVLDQSWQQNVGLANYVRLFTDSSILGQFGQAFVWTLVFAFGSVLLTFVVGFFLALVLNDDRIRGKKLYRSFLLLPYAIPGFVSLLVWANFYNHDFGLINELLHLHINWLGDPTMAKVAVLLTNLWMGFPYMFIVCTGALQSIPADVKEAAKVDGATGIQATLRITAPLLLVAVAPLLVSSFAFNFNNFNAIELLTGGGPFETAGDVRGGTDILISMIYRMAFGGARADYGFASAVSVVLFVITGVLAALQFRATKALEDIN